MRTRNKVEMVRKCLRKLANRGAYARRVYPLDSGCMVTDGAALYWTPRKTRARERFHGEAGAARLIASANAARRWRIPPRWPRVYQAGVCIQVGRNFYDVRYVTLARYLLGAAAKFAVVDAGTQKTNNGAPARALVISSNEGTALIMPLRWPWDEVVRWA